MVAAGKILGLQIARQFGTDLTTMMIGELVAEFIADATSFSRAPLLPLAANPHTANA